MISIGNDIISLHHTNPERTIQPRFYSKILSVAEIELYFNNYSDELSLHNFVWLAWSVKESVYKFYKRVCTDIVFSPTKIIIQKINLPFKPNVSECKNKTEEGISLIEEECYCCEVNFNAHIFYTRSIIEKNFVFTVSSNATDFSHIFWGIKMIDDTCADKQSQAVRTFVLEKLNKLFAGNEMTLEKSKFCYPVLLQHKDVLISFAHHGNFVAYSFYLPLA